jgi:hypothetical protein
MILISALDKLKDINIYMEYRLERLSNNGQWQNLMKNKNAQVMAI